jgi:hypothetical protein
LEAILAEAALANASLTVAKAVMQAELRREGTTVEAVSAKAEEALEKIAAQLVFGRVPAQTRKRQRRAEPEVKVLSFRSLVEAEQGDGNALLRSVEQPVQFAMFAP